MPTHEPELSGPYYGGEFFDGDYGREPGARVSYFYTEDDGYSYDPDAPGDVEWLDEPVARGPDVNWSDAGEQRQVGTAILTHYCSRAPTADEIELFMEKIAPALPDGLPLESPVGQLEAAGLRR